MKKDNQTVVDSSLTQLSGLYQKMLKIRVAEEWIAQAVRRGEIKCPVHLCTGQEAVAVGVCAHLNDRDYVFGNHRSHGHYLAKCGDLRAMVAEIYGRVTGCAKGRGGSMHLLCPQHRFLANPVVGSTIAQAVGTALASSIRGDGAVSVAFFGDGAVEEGSFYESLNLASLYQLPVVFVCENNFYSSHLPLRERQREDNIYKRAELFGMPAFRINGNNVTEVYEAAHSAIDKIRKNQGPAFLECRTYRWYGHVGPHDDLDKGLRTADELQWWKDQCPLKRLKEELLGSKAFSQEALSLIYEEIVHEVEDAFEFANSSPKPRANDLLQFVEVKRENQ